MSKAHEVFLQDLMRMPGIKSALLVNNRGEVLLSAGQFALNSQATVQMGVLLAQLSAVAEIEYNKVEEISMVFADGRITTFTNLDLMIETTYGTQEVFLILVSVPAANLPTMRMTVKVAADKLKRPCRGWTTGQRQCVASQSFDARPTRCDELGAAGSHESRLTVAAR